MDPIAFEIDALLCWRKIFIVGKNHIQRLTRIGSGFRVQGSGFRVQGSPLRNGLLKRCCFRRWKFMN
jgi:hypothetical protein